VAREREPDWQPISALALIASLIDGQLESGREQHEKLRKAAVRRYALDDATVQSLLRVYGDTNNDLWLYDEQLLRWTRQALTAAQRREVQRLRNQMAALHDVITQILTLADELKTSTIDALLAKSDLEVGLEWLSRGESG
jgi:hypothetical protein